MGLFDTILKVGSYWNWIGPAAGIAGDVVRGGVCLDITPPGGRSVNDVKRALHQAGIHTWGMTADWDTWYISVDGKNEKRARRILEDLRSR